MLLKLAWRNIWRNKRRSLVVLGSVVVGVVSLLFMDAFMNGWMIQMLLNQMKTSTAHIQIHKNGFYDNKTIHYTIENVGKIEKVIDDSPSVLNYSRRVITFGLLSSATNSTGIYLNGVDAEEEKKVSNIYEQIIAGSYLTGGGKEMVVGEKLAEKIGVELGDKVVLLANTPDASIASEVFRIKGIFRSTSSAFDKSNVFIPIQTAQNMLEIGDGVMEFALILDDYTKAPEVGEAIGEEIGERYEVMSYKDILPLLIMQTELSEEFSVILNLFIGLALIFGIINSMLMAVFERIREFGVLMSIGMKNIKLFSMIMLEALIVGLLGTVIGVIIGVLLVSALSSTGINFSAFSESLTSFGIGAVIYPKFVFENVMITLFFIPFVALLGALYPAYKAVKLEPVNATKHT